MNFLTCTTQTTTSEQDFALWEQRRLLPPPTHLSPHTPRATTPYPASNATSPSASSSPSSPNIPIVQPAIISHLSIMTFNIRAANHDANDPVNSWEQRRESIAELINRYHPSVIGTQEGLPRQLAELKSMLDGYDFVGRSRSSAEEDEHAAIFFDSELLRVERHGHFWLSQTPDIPGSISWASSNPRMATYAVFNSRTRDDLLEGVYPREFVVVNTHLDHVSIEARNNAAKLILKLLPKILNNQDITETSATEDDGDLDGYGFESGMPIFLVGDFNSSPFQGAHTNLVGVGKFTDAWLHCEYLSQSTTTASRNAQCVTNGIAYTVHLWWGYLFDLFFFRLCQYTSFVLDANEVAEWNRYHIDWILFANPTTTTERTSKSHKDEVHSSASPQGVVSTVIPRTALVITETRNGAGTTTYPSDHFPLIVLFQVQTQ